MRRTNFYMKCNLTVFYILTVNHPSTEPARQKSFGRGSGTKGPTPIKAL